MQWEAKSDKYDQQHIHIQVPITPSTSAKGNVAPLWYLIKTAIQYFRVFLMSPLNKNNECYEVVSAKHCHKYLFSQVSLQIIVFIKQQSYTTDLFKNVKISGVSKHKCPTMQCC